MTSSKAEENNPESPVSVPDVLATVAELRRESARIVARAQFPVQRKERREMVRRFEALRKQGKAIAPRVAALLAAASDAATRERLKRDVAFLDQLMAFQLLQDQPADA
jgi:hypothetical protein